MTNSDYCTCPKAPGGVLEVDDMETKRHVVCGKVIGAMTNSEQGAECMVAKRYGGDGYFEWCDAHVRPYDQCTISALQAKVAEQSITIRVLYTNLAELYAKLADLEKEREGMVTIEELGEKLRAVEIPLRSRIRALEAALKGLYLDFDRARNSTQGNLWVDHACGKCAGATMIQPNFLCGFHMAEEALRPSQSPTTGGQP